MKTIFLALTISLGSFQAMASFSHQCEFSGKIEKVESVSANSTNLRILFSSRTFKTWMFGGSICKSAVGKTFSAAIPSDDEYLKELNFGTSEKMFVFKICPDEVPGCYWDWQSYKLTEQ
ncbi:MAG: hypothetical protein AAGB31_01950 [Bdellovibrio sp.]